MLGFHGISVAPISALVTTQATLPAGKQSFTTINGPAYATSLRTHVQGFNALTQSALFVQPPFNKTDWPNPKQTPRGQQFIPAQNFLTLARPFRQSDWPLPKTPQRAKDFQQFRSLVVSTLAVPFKQHDWPNPRAVPRPTFNSLPQTLSLPLAMPFAFMAWTLPIRPQQPVIITYQPFSFPINHPFIPPPLPPPDCGHLYPSTSVLASLTEAFYTAGILTEAVSAAGSQSGAISKSGSTRSSASKGGSLKSEIPC